MESRGHVVIGYVLTGIAGWVDAQGFLALKGVFVSFMTGNTTLLGLALASDDPAGAWPIALVIGLFLTGCFCGAVLSGASGRWSMTAVLGAAAAVLAVALVFASGAGMTNAGAVLLAFAMGVQNAAVVTVGPVRTGTTYVTGTLVSAGQELGKLVRGRGSAAVFAETMATWIALLVGVTAGAAADARVGLIALAVPCLAMAAIAAGSARAAARA